MRAFRRGLMAAVLLLVVVSGVGLLIFGTPVGVISALVNAIVSFGNPPGTLIVEVRTGAASPEVSAPADIPDADEWPSYNRTLTSQRYSPLDQINRQNVPALRVLC